MKKLSKKQKIIDIQRDIKRYLKNELEPKMMKEANELISDIELDDVFLDKDNNEIKNFIISSNLKN